MAALSDAQLDQIAEKILILGDRAHTRLPKPANTGPDAFTSAFTSQFSTDVDFKDLGIGVIDFTRDTLHPRVWIQNGDVAWRIGSTAKISLMLAAVQLRMEVRRIVDMGIVTTAADFDDLFSSPKLWKRAKSNRSELLEIAGKGNAPRISTMFDFTKSPVEFSGPEPDTPDRTNIVGKLPAGGHLTWEKASDFTFSERFWLTGGLSDNVAATSCVSEIGVPYIKAVQRAYGLFAHPAHGMHLLLAGGFSNHDFIKKPIPVDSSAPHSPNYRGLTHIERTQVKDVLFDDPKTRTVPDKYSWVPGSAAALTAFMIALMTDAFADPGTGVVAGMQGCQTVRNNLADGRAHVIVSFMADGPHGDQSDGISSVTSITREINKIGILTKDDGEEAWLSCEFIYVETKEHDPPERQMQYAVVATGLRSRTQSANLGKLVHTTLLGL